MNPSGEEKRIRDLFAEMRGEDEQAAPPFERDWAAARARQAGRRFYPGALRLAAVTIVLLAVVAAAFLMFGRGGDALQEIAMPAELPQVEPTPLPNEPPKVVALTPARTIKPKPVRRPRVADKQMHAAVSLSGWRSPTGSLLKSPSDEMLKSLPRIGESVKEMKSMLNDRMN